MENRIPLQIIDGRLVLMAVVECNSLRVQQQIMNFVIDTGSPDSYVSDKDVRKLQISLKNRSSKQDIDFGGSRFKQVSLPKFKMYLLKQDNKKFSLNVSLSALKTTKTSEKKIQTAQMLPSILGLDFLREQKAGLHVVLTEDLAYLEFED